MIRITHSQHLLDILTSYRAWREAQKAFTKAVEGGDKATIDVAEETLRQAYDEYHKHTPRKE